MKVKQKKELELALEKANFNLKHRTKVCESILKLQGNGGNLVNVCFVVCSRGYFTKPSAIIRKRESRTRMSREKKACR